MMVGRVTKLVLTISDEGRHVSLCRGMEPKVQFGTHVLLYTCCSIEKPYGATVRPFSKTYYLKQEAHLQSTSELGRLLLKRMVLASSRVIVK
jgi:hypothetical protein